MLSDEELRAGVGKDAEALAATVEKKMSKLRETEVLLSVAQSGVEDLKKVLS